MSFFSHETAIVDEGVIVKNRDELQTKLKEQGVPRAVHYPMPLHLQECFAYLEYE